MNDAIPLARRDAIAGRLAQGQSVSAPALAQEFGVSEDAIRRDLRALAAEGRCRRVYGGALPLLPASVPMAARLGEGRERKEALARAAVAGIQPGEFVFLDCGSTNLAVAVCLPEDHDLTVATNSPDIAAALLRRQDLQLILVGGSLDPVVGGCVDAEAVLGVARMRVDRCFLGACSVSAVDGIGAFSYADASFKRRLLSVSRQALVLVTSEKLGACAPHHVAPLEAVAGLVVEQDAPSVELEALALAGATVLKAEAPGRALA